VEGEIMTPGVKRDLGIPTDSEDEDEDEDEDVPVSC
jgi:hypothetical protein